MHSWRFYQGMRNEWRWYRINEMGEVLAASDQAFAELAGCMANAQEAGFDQHGYQVLARKVDAASAVSNSAEVPGTRPIDRAGMLVGTPQSTVGGDSAGDAVSIPEPATLRDAT